MTPDQEKRKSERALSGKNPRSARYANFALIEKHLRAAQSQAFGPGLHRKTIRSLIQECLEILARLRKEEPDV